MNEGNRDAFMGKSGRFFATFKGLSRTRRTLLDQEEEQRESSFLQDIEYLLCILRSSNDEEECIKAADRLSEQLSRNIVMNGAEIWKVGRRHISGGNSVEMRRSGFLLMSACIRSQRELSAVERYMFYQDIQEHDVKEDFAMCLDILRELTNDGRDITAMESTIMRLLSSWLFVCFKNTEKSRLKSRQMVSRHSNDVLYEENLKVLFTLITNIVKFHYSVFKEEEVVMLINDVIWISKKTTNKNDIKNVIHFLDVVIRYGYIPISALTNCVEILCSANIGILEFEDISWNIMKNLLKSHIAYNTVQSLKKFLETRDKLHSNVIIGAARFLSWILTTNEQNRLFSIPHGTIMETYKSALSLNIPQVDLEILKALRDFIGCKHIQEEMNYDEWDIPLEILTSCSKYLQYFTAQNKLLELPDMEFKDDIYTLLFQVTGQILSILQDLYNNSCYSGSSRKLIQYFSKIHTYLPESTCILLLDYYSIHYHYNQDYEKWPDNPIFIAQSFFKSSYYTTKVRIKALDLIKNIISTGIFFLPDQLVNDVFLSLFDDFSEECDHVVILESIKGLVEMAYDGNDIFFNKTIKILEKFSLLTFHQIEKLNSLTHQNSQDNSFTSVLGENVMFKDEKETIALASSKGLITLFLYYLRIRNNAKCIQLYKIILSIASNFEGNSDVRISALQILVRIRADSSHFIYLISDVGDLPLASNFKRNGKLECSNFSETIDRESSIELKIESNKTKSQQDNINNNVKSDKYLYNVLWTIPEKLHVEISPVDKYITHLKSCNINKLMFEITLEQSNGVDQILPISTWLKIVIDILKNEKDWEIYLYILVHISSQLRNKHLFCDSVHEIRELRTLIVDQLFDNVLVPVLLPDNFRKTDVMIALIDILIVLISYHNKYTKNEQDEIVVSFQMGLQKWSYAAKSCIHALTICCYELPISMSKLLSGILVKLSQLITSSTVSIHILEFLSSLARLPNVYANFTEADFRRVFGISLQYIQHSNAFTRSQLSDRSENVKESGQTSTSSTQMSQYVLTLAYNIIYIWFLALKLSERRKYVAWIVRGLLLANPLKNGLDEQSQTCYDMLLRFSYSNADIKGTLSNYTPDPFAISKTWLHGNSFITIDTSNSSDIIELIIRRSSGTVHFSCQPRESMNNENRTSDDMDGVQDQSIENAGSRKMPIKLFSLELPLFLPSYVLLQVSFFPELLEQSRPYLLADNEFTKRTLSVFDRIPVVDFHKIGVVYVAPGQSTESEILANTCGSQEYLNFMEGLGDLTRLKGNKTIYTGGLDIENNHDGEFAYFWKDKITQIIYHCCTLMPTNLETDPHSTLKKRHIGNDFVNIIFNESGSPYIFDTIPGQFNFINIVISRNSKYNYNVLSCKEDSASDIFFLVKLLQKKGVPEIGSIKETMISAKALPIFVRNLALHASTFSQIYHQIGGEYITNWRERLRHILRVKAKFQQSDSILEQPTNLSTTHQSTIDSSNSKLLDLDNINDHISYLEKALDFTVFS
ncbi:hypothetical protein T552_03478 [Pneumocystis carinii B80]|uniref:Rap-GAP domain-containing protein n=1 Tax=Pneumocystis carinii (strain B80) TaxID=1408658 RepID=A0A0W4ZB56_PNEC8|nr:hypothetical protein T552_03478 [Pneumocystis carinii B80]KTW25618.1 hypothetical protein T552_03478 [Pneumocystis carinii B80]